MNSRYIQSVPAKSNRTATQDAGTKKAESITNSALIGCWCSEKSLLCKLLTCDKNTDKADAEKEHGGWFGDIPSAETCDVRELESF